MSEPRPPLKFVVHPDRKGVPRWLLATLLTSVVVAMAVVGQAVTAYGRMSSSTGLVLGALVALLAVLGLPSLPMRSMARACIFASAIALVRLGTVGSSLTSGSQGLLVWVVAAVTTLVAANRLDTGVRPMAPPAAPPAPSAAEGSTAHGPTRWFTARAAVMVTALALLATVLFAPSLSRSVGGSAQPGEGPQGRPDAGSSLMRSNDELDMTTRPDLTDETVMTVTTDRPSFLRGETYDLWDGRRWTRSDDTLYAIAGGSVVADRSDLGASGADEFTQRIRLEASYSDLFFAAPSAVRIDTRNDVAQRLDGTLVTWRSALGRGSTYTVTSRRPVISEERLRAVDTPAPDDLTARYASPPEATGRVTDLAQRIVADAGASTTYDKIRALEAWMGDNTEYSLDAPLSPEGVDVVDHFLFDAKEGWCEQIASSLVVMARANGIPTRLVTGYVATERDRLTGDYVVRAKNAHAWAEVWFPEVGWVPFDPTADVPLSATADTDTTASEWVLGHLILILVAGAVAVVVGWGLRRLLSRLWQSRQDRPTTWAGVADRRLTELAERASITRAAGDTSTSLGRTLADLYEEPGLVEVGRVIDDSVYAATPPSDHDRNKADELLAAVGESKPDPKADG